MQTPLLQGPGPDISLEQVDQLAIHLSLFLTTFTSPDPLLSPVHKSFHHSVSPHLTPPHHVLSLHNGAQPPSTRTLGWVTRGTWLSTACPSHKEWHRVLSFPLSCVQSWRSPAALGMVVSLVASGLLVNCDSPDQNVCGWGSYSVSSAHSDMGGDGFWLIPICFISDSSQNQLILRQLLLHVFTQSQVSTSYLVNNMKDDSHNVFLHRDLASKKN